MSIDNGTSINLNSINDASFPFSGESTPARDIYAKTAISLDKIRQIYTVGVLIGTLGVFVMPFARPFYHFLIGQYSFASWYTPYKTM